VDHNLKTLDGFNTFQWMGNIAGMILFIFLSLVFNATFSNISAISWRPVLAVEEARVPREREPPTMGKQLLSFITCGCELSASFL
jgi:hypothetical protein